MASGRPGGPPMPPANGDHSMGPTMNGVTWTLTSIATLFVAARLYARFKLIRTPGWDDFWIVISICLGIAYAGLMSKSIAEGNGRHTYYLEMPQLIQALKWNSLAFPPGILSLAVPKLAVVALLQRLLRPNVWHLAFLWTMAISTVILITAGPVLLWTQCSPHRAIWDLTVAPTAKCIDASITVNVAIASGTLSAFADIYLAIYPIIVLSKLKMQMRKKIGLCLVLSMGFVAGSIAIYKTTTLPLLYDHSDYTYATAKIFIWTSVEANVIVIAACIPTLRPVYLQIVGRPQTQVGGSATKPSSYDRWYRHVTSKLTPSSRKWGSSKSSDTDIDLVEKNRYHNISQDNDSGHITKTVSVSIEAGDRSSPYGHHHSHSQRQNGW